MKLGSFILRRLLLAILVLIGLSMVIFIIARVVPGDPARLALGVSYISKVHFLKARIIAFFTNYLAVNNLLFKN